MNNLYSLPTIIPNELTETLAESPSVRIERIISHGQASPDGFWYDQTENEWAVVLKGNPNRANGQAMLRTIQKDQIHDNSTIDDDGITTVDVEVQMVHDDRRVKWQM